MEKSSQCCIERLLQWLKGWYLANKTPFLAAMVTGLATHMFMFTNKLVNHDDIEALFSKGATITSGRWGLELSKLLFPDWSMPWIYGLLTLLMISVAVSLMVSVLDIRSKPTQLLLAALVLSFPSLTGTFCFMFTSSAYGLAFLFSVLCVHWYQRGGRLGHVLSVLALVLCLSIYQAYIAITASLFVILMIKDCLEEGKNVWQIVRYGLRALLMMGLALALYFGITMLVFRFTGAEFNAYVVDNVNAGASIPGKIRMAYESFRDIFSYRNYYLISTETSRWLHLVLALLILAGLFILGARRKNALNWVLLAVLTLLLPLSINCVFLLMSPQSIHTLVLYSFVCFYFLAAVVIEKLDISFKALAKDAVLLIFSVAVISNVYFANMTYLKLHLQYESAASFYVSLIAQIKETEGFDENSRLAIIGRQDNLLYQAPELDTQLLLGPTSDLINIYSRQNFFRQYLGFDIPFASTEEEKDISALPEFREMAEYPYYGSVRKIDDYIVVKLG